MRTGDAIWQSCSRESWIRFFPPKIWRVESSMCCTQDFTLKTEFLQHWAEEQPLFLLMFQSALTLSWIRLQSLWFLLPSATVDKRPLVFFFFLKAVCLREQMRTSYTNCAMITIGHGCFANVFALLDLNQMSWLGCLHMVKKKAKFCHCSLHMFF